VHDGDVVRWPASTTTSLRRCPTDFPSPAGVSTAAPPAVVVAIVTPGVEPPVRDAVAVRAATSALASAPWNRTVNGPPALPETTTSPTPMFDSASSAAWTAAADALYAIAAVVWPEKVRVNVPRWGSRSP
jgi:hypothetical protein